jgi:hypothetical protein
MSIYLQTSNMTVLYIPTYLNISLLLDLYLSIEVPVALPEYGYLLANITICRGWNFRIWKLYLHIALKVLGRPYMLLRIRNRFHNIVGYSLLGLFFGTCKQKIMFLCKLDIWLFCCPTTFNCYREEEISVIFARIRKTVADFWMCNC